MASSCGGCAARRAAEAANKMRYIWTSPDGKNVVEYTKEAVAKGKVMKRGGSYVRKVVS